MVKSLMKRKFRIGQWVRMKSGKRAKVIGSALFGFLDGKPTRLSHVEYRLKPEGSKRTVYRREDELRKG